MITSSPATQKKLRLEATVIKRIRELVVTRDGFCRLACNGVGPCQGVSEWAHFGALKRSKTRGMAPADRHTTAGSFMACTRHHRLYDAGQLHLEAEDAEAGCDGRLRINGAAER